MYQQGLDQLKFELMKLSLLFDSLPMHQKEYIHEFVPKSGKKKADFQAMIRSLRDDNKWTGHSVQSAANHGDGLELDWMGTR